MRRHEKAPQRAQRTGGLSNGAPLSGLTAHFRPFASGGPPGATFLVRVLYQAGPV
jgi:hypothetical protein